MTLTVLLTMSVTGYCTSRIGTWLQSWRNRCVTLSGNNPPGGGRATAAVVVGGACCTSISAHTFAIVFQNP